MSILEIIKERNTAHKDAFKIESSTLKKKDREKVIKLLSKIRKKENIAEKLKKSSYDIQTILKTKITFEYPDEGIEQTFTLLHHAIHHENSQAVKDIVEEAKKQSLLEQVLNEEMMIKRSDGKIEKYTILSCAKLCGNSKVVDEILKMVQDEKILKGIFDENPNEQLTLPNVEKETAMNEPEVKGQKDILHTETNTQLHEDTNKNSEDLEALQPTCESKEEAQNASVDTAAREPNTPEIQPSTEPCSESGKRNSAEGKSSNQPIVASIVGIALLVSSVASYIMSMPIVAAIVGIVGLACISFALYNALKPNTKLEKVEQPLVSFESNSMLKSSR
ncbi:MAG: hypothetical protein ACR5K9_08870 [Wolbachia sp.]